MAKKIRFPLKLSEGAEVRTLDELREHFDLEAVLGYYASGKLLTWLEDRYLEGEAEAIRALDEAAPDFQKKLCEVFQVEYTGSDIDLEEIERRQERLKRLQSITDEAEYIQNIDYVAFDQEELADLLDEGVTKIYLCGDKFTVPASRKGITYIGIKNPAVHISGKLPDTLEELGITFDGCNVDNLQEINKFDAAGTVDCVKLGCGSYGERVLHVYLREPVSLNHCQYDRVPLMDTGHFEELKLRKDSRINIHLGEDGDLSVTVIEEGSGVQTALPQKCPYCGGQLRVKDKKLFCENSECSGNRVGKYLGFLDALGLDGYGEAFVQELLKNFDKKLTGFSFLAELTADDLKKVGMDDKLSREFPEKIHAALQVTPDYKIIGAMGWPDVGPARAKEILKICGGVDGFSEMAAGANSIIMPQLLFEVLGKVGANIGEWLYSKGQDAIADLHKLAQHMGNITTDFSEKYAIGHATGDLRNKNERSVNRVGKYLGFLDALGLDGYGEAFVQELLKNFDKKLTGFSFLAELTVDDLKKVGMDDKLSREFPEKIHAALQVTPDYKVIGAMGWPDVGPARAKEILKCYEDASKAGDNNEAGIDELIGVTEMKIIGSPFLVTFLGKVGQKIDAWFSKYGTEVGKDLKALRKYMGNITTDFSVDKYKVGHTGGELSARIVEL